MDKKEIAKCVVHAVLEYGCASVLSDLMDAVTPYRTSPVKKAIKKLSAYSLGTCWGAHCADEIIKDWAVTLEVSKQKDILMGNEESVK